MLNKSDSLFATYDPKQFRSYKDLGLIKDSAYGNYLDRALQQRSSSDSTVIDYVNPLGLVRYGPYSNIAGKYLTYIQGDSSDVQSSPRSKYGHTDPVSYKVTAPPSAGDLARGWAVSNDIDGFL